MNLQGGGLVLFPTSDEASCGPPLGPDGTNKKLRISKKIITVCAENIDSLGTHKAWEDATGVFLSVRIIELEAE